MLAGFAAGSIGVLAGMPDVTTNDGCTMYRVDRKAITAYVLKPPVLEQAKCEAFCPTPMVKQPEPKAEPAAETTNEPEATKDESDEPRKRRRHHRYRRYWR